MLKKFVKKITKKKLEANIYFPKKFNAFKKYLSMFFKKCLFKFKIVKVKMLLLNCLLCNYLCPR